MERGNFRMARNFDFKLNVFGFPRSGNTYMHNALCLMYPNNMFISPRHTVWEIKNELQKGNEVVIVFRNPLDSISSWSLYRQERIFPIEDMNWNDMTINDDIKFYLRFYNEMIALKEDVIFMDFDKFIADSSYIETKIKSKTGLLASMIPTSDQVKEEMLKDYGALNLPRETKVYIEEVKPVVQANPLFADTLSLYQSIQDLEKAQ